MIHLRSSSTGQQLRRGWSGSTAVRVVVRGRRVLSSKVTAAAPLPAAVEVAGGAGREDSIEAVAPRTAGAGNMPSRKKPMDGYLNKVRTEYRFSCLNLHAYVATALLSLLVCTLSSLTTHPRRLWSDDGLTCPHTTKQNGLSRAWALVLE